jgi:hypothetical protein
VTERLAFVSANTEGDDLKVEVENNQIYSKLFAV